MTTEILTPSSDSRIKCSICGALIHSIQHHLAREHAEIGMSVAQYQEAYPGAEILSEMAKSKIADHIRARTQTEVAEIETSPTNKVAFHTLFALGSRAATLGSSGAPIMITTIPHSEEYASMIPDIDPNYVWKLDTLKTLMMALEMRIPAYLWGHSGTGKTSIFEQIAARTGRAFFRVQHTANMEEEHIVGGWRLRDGKTFFELGPLAMAMKYGWMYMADEYDFGRPEVTSVYQAILEGKPLVIKEADAENRVIRPHANFCFVATGNTNGQGDESGLYQGTNIQNSANYERFGVVEEMEYMNKKLEIALVSQRGDIPALDAEKLVDFATRIRTEFDSGKIGNPISPRSLIYAARIGAARGDYLIGLQKAFINRLSSTDREAANQVGQRVFA